MDTSFYTSPVTAAALSRWKQFVFLESLIIRVMLTCKHWKNTKMHVKRHLKSYRLGKMYPPDNPYHLLGQRKPGEKTFSFASTSRQSNLFLVSYSSHVQSFYCFTGSHHHTTDHDLYQMCVQAVPCTFNLEAFVVPCKGEGPSEDIGSQAAAQLQTAFAFLPAVQLQKPMEMWGLSSWGCTGMNRKQETSFKKKLGSKKGFETLREHLRPRRVLWWDQCMKTQSLCFKCGQSRG